MDSLDEHLEANSALVEQRLSMGDVASRPRSLDHLASFPRKAVAAAVHDLTDAGFEVNDVKKGLRRTRIEFSRTDTADLDSANAFTRQIVEITNQHGGTYDGWAGFIVSDS